MSLRIENLRDSDIGRWVCYKDNFRLPQKGRIKSWNDKYIFVVYACDGNWSQYEQYTAEATDPLELAFTQEVQE